MVSLEKKVCPQPVQDQINLLTFDLEESGFFISKEIPEGYHENAKIHLWNIVADILIKKFIDGDPLYIADSEDELNRLLTRVCVYTCMDSMVDKGLLNSFDDENGEEQFFLTEKGKEVIKHIDGTNYTSLF